MDDLKQPEALRLADELDKSVLAVCADAAAELRRLHDLLGKSRAINRIRSNRITALETANVELLEALRYAEAGLADIGDADREPGDDLKWCEERAAEAIPTVRAAIAKHGGGA